MLKKGDRVYHKGISGNGLIVAIDDTKQVDKYGVVFNWLAHKDVDFHNLGGRYPRNQCRWCSEDQLVKSEMPIGFVKSGRVSMVGNRSLERLIRRITRMKRTRDVYDDTEIVINYGAGTRYAPPQALVLNGNASETYDKYIQCKMMAKDGVPVPNVHMQPYEDTTTGGEWILKPHFGFGGHNIEEYRGQDPQGRFLQRKVNKVREFRVHVALWYPDPAWLIQEKKIDDTSQLCWNKKQGGSFHYVHEPHFGKSGIDEDLIAQLSDIGIRAVEALGLDFGGVDLALCDDGKIWVFEVNTRCGMLERTLAGFKKVVWHLQNLNIGQYLEMLESRRELIYSSDEDDEEFFDEDEIELELTEVARVHDSVVYDVEEHIEEESKPIRRSVNLADQEVGYAYR